MQDLHSFSDNKIFILRKSIRIKVFQRSLAAPWSDFIQFVNCVDLLLFLRNSLCAYNKLRTYGITLNFKEFFIQTKRLKPQIFSQLYPIMTLFVKEHFNEIVMLLYQNVLIFSILLQVIKIKEVFPECVPVLSKP